MASRRPLVFHFWFAVCVWLAWYSLAGGQAAIGTVLDNWQITLTMVFGSFIAGATSEGGGAVAFPVFTKALNISPQDAKVFSLAIQSVGMTAATVLIIVMGLRVEWRVIRWASLAGVPGIITGATLLAPNLPPAVIKMTFTVMVTSFAFTLFALNRGIRLCHDGLSHPGRREIAMVSLAGFLGGLMSGMVGNGIDIVTFSLMVLLFRINEKVATPTSVILMAINSLVGFALHAFVIGGFTPQVQDYWIAAIPVVVVGAPLGAIICSLLDRLLIARLLIVLIFIELVTSLLIIPLTTKVLLVSGGLLVVFSGLYLWMYSVQTYEPQQA
jgi:uncharacterized membrane protein YfcA